MLHPCAYDNLEQ